MTNAQIVSIIMTAGILIVGILGFMWRLSKDVGKTSKEGEEKRGKLYKHVDDYFVRETVCKVQHKAVSDNLARLDRTLESGFKSLQDKMDALLSKNGL